MSAIRKRGGLRVTDAETPPPSVHRGILATNYPPHTRPSFAKAGRHCCGDRVRGKDTVSAEQTQCAPPARRQLAKEESEEKVGPPRLSQKLRRNAGQDNDWSLFAGIAPHGGVRSFSRDPFSASSHVSQGDAIDVRPWTIPLRVTHF